MLLLSLGQSLKAEPQLKTPAETAQEKAQKKTLILDSFEELGLALRLQRKCKILAENDGRALGYYAIEMRKHLNDNESAAVIKALNGKATLKFQAKVKAAKGDQNALCSKEVMGLLEDSLTSATLVNEMLGNKPFDAVADRHRIIMNMLKITAQLKGAVKQCPKRMKESGFSSLVSKISMNNIVLSAMGTMRGIDRKEISALKKVSNKTAKMPKWKQQCKVAILQKHNGKMQKLIAQLRE